MPNFSSIFVLIVAAKERLLPVDIIAFYPQKNRQVFFAAKELEANHLAKA